MRLVNCQMIGMTHKLNSLKYNIGKVKECLEKYDNDEAKRWLHRVLPYG